MKAVIFGGRQFAREKEIALKEEFAALRSKGAVPKLVFILVGENEEAEFYVRLKEKMAKKLGVDFEIKRFGKETTERTIASYINRCSRGVEVRGITFEYPLPDELEKTLPKFLPPAKDIDCLGPENLGRLVLGNYFVLSSTVRAILEILELALGGSCRSAAPGPFRQVATLGPLPWGSPPRVTRLENFLRGIAVCLVGWGTLVGRPLAVVLKNLGATVTICDSKTQNLAAKTREAEILISATGIPGLIKKEMVRKGAVVIDAGFTKLKIKNKQSLISGENEKLKMTERVMGDVEPEVVQVASFLTPVPGGLGPVTITSLFENLLDLSYRKINSWK